MAVGRHTAKAISNIGGIIGGAMEKKAIHDAEEERLNRKERIRAEERASDRAFDYEKLEAQQTRHEESLAAAKERNLASISSREKEAALSRESAESRTAANIESREKVAGARGGYSLKEQVDDTRAELGQLRRSLDAMTPASAGREELQARIAEKEAEYEDLKRQAVAGTRDEPPPEHNPTGFINVISDRGLVGRGMGALRQPETSDNAAATGDNQGVRTQEEFDAAYRAAKPGDIIRYWDEETGSWKRVRKAGD